MLHIVNFFAFGKKFCIGAEKLVMGKTAVSELSEYFEYSLNSPDHTFPIGTLGLTH